MTDSQPGIIQALEAVLEARKGASPDSSYVAKLYDQGLDKILKKVGEESTEVVLAAKDGDKEHLANEVADLLFHLLVLMRSQDLPFSRVEEVLAARFGLSGLEEKAARQNKD